MEQFSSRANRREMAIIALAGPLMNILVALVSSVVKSIPLFYNLMTTNIILAIFNMLPIGILDGARVFSYSRSLWLISFAFMLVLSVIMVI